MSLLSVISKISQVCFGDVMTYALAYIKNTLYIMEGAGHLSSKNTCVNYLKK